METAVDITGPYKPQHPVRFVTATSLFDGHDAAINLIRRMLQSSGAEVIHLGHNRSVAEIVDAAIEEDVQGIAVSSYQGGHIEFFSYMLDLLTERKASHIKVFGGGGGVIVPREIQQLEARGVEKIFSPEDGRRLGLQGMIDRMISACDFDPIQVAGEVDADGLIARNPGAIARAITTIEQGNKPQLPPKQPASIAPVIGITGTGGAGKSSVSDELLIRFLNDFPELNIAILAVDPTRRRSGGALLADRIRMNSLVNSRVYMRSLATRNQHSELSEAIPDTVRALRATGFDLIIVETSGIGQGNTEIVDVSDLSVYVMTAEYGAASQLEKIDMLDFADIVVLNKFDKSGASDALRAVRKQYRRNRELSYDISDEDLPVFGTVASSFNDSGMTALYLGVLKHLSSRWKQPSPSKYLQPQSAATPIQNALIPPEKTRYLADIAECCRSYRSWVLEQAQLAEASQSLACSIELIKAENADISLDDPVWLQELETRRMATLERLDPNNEKLLEGWDGLIEEYQADALSFQIRGKEFFEPLFRETLGQTRIPRVACPRYSSYRDRLKWLLLENFPGRFPFTAGVFLLKRRGEDPTRMFAGEGTPMRTNRRFHYLSAAAPANRLSTAFDSVTLYGHDPAERPDIYGKIGESGVSICTIEDMARLFEGFELCHPKTSVSMTINGPAPFVLAMFLNVAVDQQLTAFEQDNNRPPTDDDRKAIVAHTLSNVRGTVQADILKEDQAQNTCIFNTEFALKMMGDIQEYFVENDVNNYYSVSVSGYHIAEAGAYPITQTAFTLANGFTYVEYYLARGLSIDDFAHNLSFFFSNGLDAEYSVIGRVARRIWAVTLQKRYGANVRSQKLKYHIQTSGRSLHAQEIQFNDIRTTLQALLAFYDNCNSLHTNAYDEAVTTPTEESVRRALAIQLITAREFGMSLNENPNQGSFIIDELTDLVEEAVLCEFERISARGGVLGAMEREYQRGKIQDESLRYERKKHSGELPIIGINTFVNEDAQAFEAKVDAMPLTRATEEERQTQLENLNSFHQKHKEKTAAALQKLKDVAISGENIFAELMDTVRVASLGQIADALYEVGGRYRRNM